MSPTEFYFFVEALCRLYDASTTSGIRSEQRNDDQGGAPRSRHMLDYGRAMDLVPDDLNELDTMLEAAHALGFDYAEIGTDQDADEPTHLHVQARRR